MSKQSEWKAQRVLPWPCEPSYMGSFNSNALAAIPGEQKPRSGFEVGLEAFLSGLTSLSSNSSL